MAREQQIRMLTPKIFYGAFGGFGARSKQEQSIFPIHCELDEERRQIGPGNSLGQRIAKQPGGPHQRSAVAKHQVRVEEDAPKFHVRLRLNEEINIRRGQRPRAVSASQYRRTLFPAVQAAAGNGP